MQRAARQDRVDIGRHEVDVHPQLAQGPDQLAALVDVTGQARDHDPVHLGAPRDHLRRQLDGGNRVAGVGGRCVVACGVAVDLHHAGDVEPELRVALQAPDHLLHVPRRPHYGNPLLVPRTVPGDRAGHRAQPRDGYDRECSERRPREQLDRVCVDHRAPQQEGPAPRVRARMIGPISSASEWPRRRSGRW